MDRDYINLLFVKRFYSPTDGGSERLYTGPIKKQKRTRLCLLVTCLLSRHQTDIYVLGILLYMNGANDNVDASAFISLAAPIHRLEGTGRRDRPPFLEPHQV